MSEPWVGTGNVGTKACTTCGLDVEADEYVGAYGSGPRLMVRAHDAPCGAPCFGGGARGKAGLDAYKAGRMHGTNRGPCPACGAVDAD